jgi:DNA repair protein RadA/Sms
MVDVVLYMEGDPLHQYRILRSSKNRFGNINEIGLFQMDSAGLAEVMTPETLFVTGETVLSSGAIRTITMEGSRPLVVELQSLTVPSGFGYPKRTSSGFPLNRLQLLIAVLIRRAGLKLFEHDVYASIVGGLSLNEAAMDFPLALAVASSLLDKPCPQDLIAVGEVGLSGAILPTPQIEVRLSEARRLGFATALVSDKGYDKIKGRQNGLNIVPVRHLEEALRHLGWKQT